MGKPNTSERDLARNRVVGQFTATAQSAWFMPEADSRFWLALVGNGTANAVVKIEVSFDGGITAIDFSKAYDGSVASYTIGANGEVALQGEQIEADVLWRFNCTWTAGAIDYRMSQ